MRNSILTALVVVGFVAPRGALFANSSNAHPPIPGRVISEIEDRLDEVQERVRDRVANNRERVCERLDHLGDRLGKNLNLPPFCDDGGTPPPPPPSAPAVSLSADPDHIIEGATSTIMWDAVDATECTATEGWVGDRPVSGEEVVMPVATTTYTLSCSGAGGTTTKSVTITVELVPAPAPLPTVDLMVDDDLIEEGATTTISWTTTHADTCVAEDGWLGARATSGNEIIAPVATTTYTLVCSNVSGSTTDSVIVNVTPATPAVPLPTVDISADPLSVTAGGTSSLSWISTDADTCTASGAADFSGAMATTSMAFEVTVLATTTYSIECSNVTGTSSDSVEVVAEVVPTPVPLPTVDIDADPLTIDEGSTSTVSWMSTDADTCTASDGFVGPRATSGDEIVMPVATTTYTITCSNASGTSSDSVTIEVIPAAPAVPLPTVDISADELSVPVGGTSTLMWISTDADTCTASGAADFSGSVGTTSSGLEVTVTATTTYMIECTNVAGTSSDSVTVNAEPVGPAPVPLPTVAISADPISVPENGTSSLSWVSTDAETCTASGAVDFVGPIATTSSGFEVTVTATTTYMIECSNATGTSSDSVEVAAEVVSAPAGTVVINEVLFDPGPSGTQGTDALNEWVEIYNGSGSTIDINGWTMHDTIDGTATDTLATTSTMVPAGGFVIVTRSTTTDDFWSYPGSTIVIYLDEPLGSGGLSNGGEAVVLRDDAGTLIDGVSWGTDTSVLDPSVDLSGIVEGNSIARSPLGTDSDSNADWMVLGTPTPGA